MSKFNSINIVLHSIRSADTGVCRPAECTTVAESTVQVSDRVCLVLDDMYSPRVITTGHCEHLLFLKHPCLAHGLRPSGLDSGLIRKQQ